MNGMNGWRNDVLNKGYLTCVKLAKGAPPNKEATKGGSDMIVVPCSIL